MKEIKTFFRMGRVVFEWRDAPRLVAGGRLDFDHVGAHVGEQFGAMKAQRRAQVEHSVTGERS
jgi:hypothetical protein